MFFKQSLETYCFYSVYYYFYFYYYYNIIIIIVIIIIMFTVTREDFHDNHERSDCNETSYECFWDV
jgi:uncharacterized membrane protein